MNINFTGNRNTVIPDSLISLAGELSGRYRTATMAFVIAMLLLAALLLFWRPGRRTKYRFIRLSAGNLLIHLMDGFITFVNTPTLSREGNILVSKFGLGWEALFGANLIFFILIVLMAQCFNRYEHVAIPSKGMFDYYMKLYYGEGYKPVWFWYKFSKNYRSKLAMLSYGLFWGLTAGAPFFVIGWLRHMAGIRIPGLNDTWIAVIFGIAVAYACILKWVRDGAKAGKA